MCAKYRTLPVNRGRNGKKDVRLFLRPGRAEKANNLIINSLWTVFYVEWHQFHEQKEKLQTRFYNFQSSKVKSCPSSR